jgi:Tfp pilus assembly protein PilZ
MPAPPGEDPPQVGRRTDNGRANRARVEVPVQLHAGTVSCSGVTKNLGPGGIFVATTRLLRVGDRVKVTLKAHQFGAAPVEALAEVRWCRLSKELDDAPAGVGLRFIDTPVRAAILTNELRRALPP